MNDNRIIETFAFCILIGILLGNNILLFKVNNNFIHAFLHINKVKVIQSAFRKKKAITV